MQHFRFSLILTVFLLAVAGWWGLHQAGMAGLLQAVWLAGVLAVMEVSLSFDNAVVNASVLRRMDPVWQRRFLTWGILVAATRP